MTSTAAVDATTTYWVHYTNGTVRRVGEIHGVVAQELLALSDQTWRAAGIIEIEGSNGRVVRHVEPAL